MRTYRETHPEGAIEVIRDPEAKCYLARYLSGPARDEILELFATDTVPLLWHHSAHPGLVVLDVRQRNPLATVIGCDVLQEASDGDIGQSAKMARVSDFGGQRILRRVDVLPHRLCGLRPVLPPDSLQDLLVFA